MCQAAKRPARKPVKPRSRGWAACQPVHTNFIVALMERAARDELLRLFKQTLAQCRETQRFWRDNDFRLTVGGIDITEAERAASDGRIEHLQNLIKAIEQNASTP